MPLVAVAVALVIGVVAVAVLLGRDDDAPSEPRHEAAVAVAERYLDAFADADPAAMCATYTTASQRRAFARYDVATCAAYASAQKADVKSGFGVTEFLETTFDVGRVTGTDRRVSVAFRGEVTYLGDQPAAIDYYEKNPTVAGAVVVVREDGAWKVDAKATEDSF